MKIIPLNNVDPTIVRQAANINDCYFQKVSATVGLFQSSKHDHIEWSKLDKQEQTSAVVVPREELDLLKRVFPELSELESGFDKSISVMVWFSKSLLQDNKHNEVVAHELKHIEQRNKSLRAFYKDRVLDFILCGKITPTEIDADNFAKMTAAKDYDKNYNWVKSVQKLFSKNTKNIEQINEAIMKNETDITVDNELFLDLGLDQGKDKRNLFRYYFSQTKW